MPHGSAALRLTLLYAADLRLEYRLRSIDTWLGLGRLLPSAGKYVPVEVPRGVAAVPRGQLLMIRYHAGVVQVRRTPERPEYSVVVDGRRLDAAPARDLRRKRNHRVPPRWATGSVDHPLPRRRGGLRLSAPELVFTLIGPGWSARLLVGQPKHADPKRVAFAVPAIEDDPAPQRIEADVIFSAAENLTADSGGWRKWHVKVPARPAGTR